MYNYDDRQISQSSRYFNNIKSCQIIKIDNEFGLEFGLPWGGTAKNKPKDFEIADYQEGQWIDLILSTISHHNYLELRSIQFIGRTPKTFLPKE